LGVAVREDIVKKAVSRGKVVLTNSGEDREI
jgi:hypothetical protein